MDKNGKQKWFTGTRSKSKTQEMARQFEDQHRLARLGLDSPELHAERRRKMHFADAKGEYLAWGEAQGGQRQGPWSAMHAYNRRIHLSWWEVALALDTMADLEGILPEVEAILRKLKENLANKTLNNYAEALRAFCDWSVTREYLRNNPLKGLKRFEESPLSQRRAMTINEIHKLLEHCAPHRRLLYEIALTTGLRANELRSLTVSDLDTQENGLRLRKEWTKNRKESFQPLTEILVKCLSKSVQLGEPIDAYTKYSIWSPKAILPNPLLYVPAHPARGFHIDLKAAGIPKENEEGKLDFHALRNTFITLAIESGASYKDVQTLARHSNPQMTFNTYARSRPEGLANAVENISQSIES
ncbi:MAG: tyrosine-type recombinase/integrase [Candidatus Latescibacterota bacterium]|jgi:integrase